MLKPILGGAVAVVPGVGWTVSSSVPPLDGGNVIFTGMLGAVVGAKIRIEGISVGLLMVEGEDVVVDAGAFVAEAGAPVSGTMGNIVGVSISRTTGGSVSGKATGERVLGTSEGAGSGVLVCLLEPFFLPFFTFFVLFLDPLDVLLLHDPPFPLPLLPWIRFINSDMVGWSFPFLPQSLSADNSLLLDFALFPLEDPLALGDGLGDC